MYSKIYVEITNICNMHCSFCHGHKRALRRMTEAEFSTVLDKIEGKTKYVYYHLMGEPLTHPCLPDFIKMAGERGFKSIITTNGTLLGQRGDELIAAGIHKINLSLHSFEEGGVEKHAEYVRSLAAFAKKAADAGVIVIFRLWNKGCDGGMNDSSLDLLREEIPGEWRENTRGIKMRERIFVDWGERFEWPDISAELKGIKTYCYGMRDQFGILVDGTVVPCCLDSEGAVNLGNIFTNDIDAILSSERAVEIARGFERGFASEELCKRCGYVKRFV